MTNQTEPAEVVIRPSMAQYPDVRNFLRRIDLEATTAEQESDETVVAQIMQGILTATNEEELFAAQQAGVLATKNFVNQPFRLRSEDVSWRRSNIESAALPFFAMLEITDLADGQRKMLAGGGATFMTVLDRLISFGSLDREEDNGEGRPLQLIAKRTGSGYDVIMIQPFNISGKTKTTPKNGTKD